MGKFEHHIFVCGNSRPPDHPRGGCDPDGTELLRDRFKKAVKTLGLRATVRANRAGCLDHCEHGPVVVVYPEAVWYGGVGLDDVDEIMRHHIMEGRPVRRLLIADDCINNPDCPHRRRSSQALREQEKRENVQD